MSREHIERIIEFSKTAYRHRKWSEFCLREGLTKDAVFHWRKKLGLPMKPNLPSRGVSQSIGPCAGLVDVHAKPKRGNKLRLT